MNNLKTGGGKPDSIPPDEALDKVAPLLGSTCEGYNVQFGGDAVVEEVEEMVQEAVVVDVPFDLENTPPVIVSPALSPHNPQSTKFLFSSTIRELKRQNMNEDIKKSVKIRNHAIAEYYIAKRKQEEEIFVLKKRKLELEILEQERRQEERK